MNIIASSPDTPLRLKRRTTVLVPDSVSPPSPDQTKALIKAATIVAAKNVGAIGVARGAWKLTTVPQTMSQQDLTTFLANNNAPAGKAPEIASDLRQLLSHPLARTVLFAVSGGSLAYLVVEKTPWSTRTKIWTSVGVGVACGALYLLLRHYGYMT